MKSTPEFGRTFRFYQDIVFMSAKRKFGIIGGGGIVRAHLPQPFKAIFIRQSVQRSNG